MRGQKTFEKIIKDGGLTGTTQKGRNNSLVTKRNECLLARYYYYGCDKNMVYEEIMRLLVSEFFLSPSTISIIIQANTDQLIALKEKRRSAFFFQSRWPHLKW